MEENLPELTPVEKLCIDIDKKIKTIYINPDNLGGLAISNITEQDEVVKEEFYNQLINQKDSELLDIKIEGYFKTQVHTYPQFDESFCYMIQNLVSVLCKPKGYESFNKNLKFQRNLFSFYEKYRILKEMPIQVSSVIMELIFSMSNPKNREVLQKYFLKKLTKRFL